MKKSLWVMGLSLAAATELAAEEMPVIEVEAEKPITAEVIEVLSDEVEGLSVDGGDFLRDLNGVSGSRFGGHGIDPVIRGQAQTRINVLLDGAYLHGGCPNRMDPPSSYATMESYDSVTVIKGSQTVVYGGGGSGGTVLFERNTPRFADGEAPRIELGGGYNSNGAQKDAYVDAAAGSTQLFARGVLATKRGEDYEDGDGNAINSAYRENSGSAILGYTPSDDRRLEVNVEAVRGRDINYVGSMDSPISDSDNMRMKYEGSGWKAEVYRTEVYHLMDNYSLRDATPLMQQGEVPSDSVTTGGRISYSFEQGLHSWTLGADDQSNNREAIRYQVSNGLSTALIWPDVDIKQRGLFAEMSREDHVKVVSAGLRYDRVEAQAHKADVAPEWAMMGMPMTPDQVFNAVYGVTADVHTENNIGGFLRYEGKMADGQSWFAGLSRSLRTADATERYISMGMMRVGRPDLDPEAHQQIDLGANLQGDAWKLGFSVYYDRVNNYILSYLITTMMGTQERFDNIGATLYGFEVDSSYRLSDKLEAGLALAYVKGRDNDNDLPLSQVPPLEATFSLSYRMSPSIDFGARLRATSAQNDVRLLADGGKDLQKTPGYAVADLFANWSAGKRGKLSVGVDNLFDLSYAEHLGREDTLSASPVPVSVNEPGRSLWLKGVVNF